MSASDGSPSSGSPDQLDPLDAEAYQQSGGGVENRADTSATNASAAAVREFLGRRCTASLARADRGAREEEKLSEYLVSCSPDCGKYVQYDSVAHVGQIRSYADSIHISDG